MRGTAIGSMVRVMPWLVCLGAGWRMDGTGVAAGGGALSQEALAAPLWTAELPGAGLSSPVRVDDRVCAMADPAWLVCVDAATGEARFQVSFSPASAAPLSAQAEIDAKIEAAEAAALALAGHREAYGRVLRKARTAPSEDTAATLATLVQDMADAQATIDAAEAWRLGPGNGTIGWTTPTPVTFGSDVCAMTSAGVAGCVGPAGEVRWRRDLGRPSPSREGYEGVPAASPVAADGVFVVSHDRLLGLDPATGESLWEGPASLGFGTPAVVTRPDGAWVATADGQLVVAASGAVVAEALGKLWYVGPYAMGDQVFYAGSVGSMPTPGSSQVRALTLSGPIDAPEVTVAWSEPMPTDDRVYASPVAWGDDLAVVTKAGELVVWSVEGKVRTHRKLGAAVGAEVWSSPVTVEEALWVATTTGTLLVLDAPDARPTTWSIPPMHATPSVEHGRAFFRSGTSWQAVSLQ